MHKKGRPRTRFEWFAMVGAALFACAAGASRCVAAEGSWEYSPYELRVWVAFAPHPALPPTLRSEFPQRLVDAAWSTVGAPWKLTVEEAPAQLHSTVLTVLDQMTADQIEAVDEKVFESDKVILVAIDVRDNDFHVTARELDCRSRVMGRVAERSDGDADVLPATAMRAILGAFSPLVRVEQSEGKQALIRVRAGGLIVDEHNPVAVKRNSLLQPVIRRNDRYGKPKRIDVIEWTYLRVDHEENNLWVCEVQTALRNPLTGRGSSRTLKLGLGVRPEGEETQLQLVSLLRERRDGKEVEVPVPMEGYEIFAKSPLPAEDGKAPNAIPLGRTDWRGMITIKRDPDYPLRLIYVKNGRFLLARLPLIPGLDAKTVSDLTSDDQRLEVEAFVRGIEATVMDIVARRHIMATRIRRRLSEGKRDEAQKLMEELVQLPGKDALEKLIASQRNAVRSPNPREQKRIDAMLTGVQMLIRRFLDDGLEVKLRDEIAGAGGAASQSAPSGDDSQKSPASKAAGKKSSAKGPDDGQKAGSKKSGATPKKS